MKYILAFALIVTLVFADSRCNGAADPKFKKFDTFHANCALAETFESSCHDIFETLLLRNDQWAQGGPTDGLHDL